MNIKISITSPNPNKCFIEYKRAFYIKGDIVCDEIIPDDCLLEICLYDCENNLVRYVYCDKKNKNIYKYHPGLTCYRDELDPNRNKMEEFGFPELIVDDINNPQESLHKANIKAWYNDTSFKAIIISASNTCSGALFDDGLDLRDEHNKPYSLLKKGKYRIEVSLKHNNKLLSSAQEDITIGERHKQLICRFNPDNHKQRMISWCKEKQIAIIEELLPGYLEPYLGTWYYHMGLLKMYRANDLALFEKARVIMFNYLIDKTSTSYETELGYLESQGIVEDIQRFTSFYYDIGEANIEDRIAKTLEFKKDEYGKICRIDILNNFNCENVYYLDRRNVLSSIFDVDNVEISPCSIAIMGVIKPIQLNPNDFILRDDLTYEMNDYPYIIRYTVNDTEIIDSRANMERIDDISIGKSVFEFYNVLDVKGYWQNIKIDCLYKKGRLVNIGYINLKVKK